MERDSPRELAERTQAELKAKGIVESELLNVTPRDRPAALHAHAYPLLYMEHWASRTHYLEVGGRIVCVNLATEDIERDADLFDRIGQSLRAVDDAVGVVLAYDDTTEEALFKSILVEVFNYVPPEATRRYVRIRAQRECVVALVDRSRVGEIEAALTSRAESAGSPCNTGLSADQTVASGHGREVPTPGRGRGAHRQARSALRAFAGTHGALQNPVNQITQCRESGELRNDTFRQAGFGEFDLLDHLVADRLMVDPIVRKLSLAIRKRAGKPPAESVSIWCFRLEMQDDRKGPRRYLCRIDPELEMDAPTAMVEPMGLAQLETEPTRTERLIDPPVAPEPGLTGQLVPGLCHRSRPVVIHLNRCRFQHWHRSSSCGLLSVSPIHSTCDHVPAGAATDRRTQRSATTADSISEAAASASRAAPSQTGA